MPRFISTHVITCMTRQDLKRLVTRLQEDSQPECRLVHAAADTASGHLACTWDARDGEAVTAFLANHQVTFRSNAEWLMHVQFDWPT